MELNSVEELVADIRAGKMVVLMDDEDRENEGDLVMAASMVTPEAINFMAKHARGLICLTLIPERCEQLGLSQMVSRGTHNESKFGTAFTVSIEAAKGVSTGISAHDRAHTIQVAVAPHAKASDIVQPGHVFPIQAVPGGVLVRAGHTEASTDLARMAGFDGAAVIVEIMNDDGTMARRPDLEVFASEHGLKIGTIADLIDHRLRHETTVERRAEYPFETRFGEFRVVEYADLVDDKTHLALVKGDLNAVEVPDVRVHVMDPLRDGLFAQSADGSGWSMDRVLDHLSQSDAGVALVLSDSFEAVEIRQSLEHFVASQSQQACEKSDSEQHAEYRTIGNGAQILKDLGVRKMRLMSAPTRLHALSGFDLEVVDLVQFSDCK